MPIKLTKGTLRALLQEKRRLDLSSSEPEISRSLCLEIQEKSSHYIPPQKIVPVKEPPYLIRGLESSMLPVNYLEHPKDEEARMKIN